MRPSPAGFSARHFPLHGMTWSRCLLPGLLLLAMVVPAVAQPAGFNYDETKVPQYTLPDPLTLASGEKVKSAEDWTGKRRGEILELFRQHVYGRAPKVPAGIRCKLVSSEPALDGLAIRRLYAIEVPGPASASKADDRKTSAGLTLNLLVYLPRERTGPVPAFLGLNFGGNHSIQNDPGIPLSTAWMRNRPERGYIDHRATEKSRGSAASRWPVKMIVQRGYALATMYYGDIDPDFHDEFHNGVHPMFDRQDKSPRPGDAWGSIAAWAWGLGRGLDCLEHDADVDGKRVAVLGHSRLGKTSLWAGARDERFALVISNDSGCGGAALSRRRFGETVARINTSFPHWFCRNFHAYNEREDELPVDQHMLIALMAPRPVYVASAVDDRWADPRGEFLSARYANPVYRLLGQEGLPAEEWPDVDRPTAGTIGYHVRTGKHDVTRYDWEQYLNFADRHLGRKE